MDPAGPLFKNRTSTDRLSRGDALFVDVIHSDMYNFGIDLFVGDIDFYPNGGSGIQPGCFPNDIACSHGRAIYFFISSINDCNFTSYKCDSYDDFLMGLCSSNKKNYMGLRANLDSNSTYYLETSGSYPFCLNQTCAKNNKYCFCTPPNKADPKKCSKLEKNQCGKKNNFLCCPEKIENISDIDLTFVVDAD